MIQLIHNRIKKSIQILQKFADRIWYPPFIGILAALDNFVVIIPNDGILISSSMLTPKRWVTLGISVAIGSTLGAIILAAFVKAQGLDWILEIYPGVNETKSWIWTKDFFDNYGLMLVFVIALTPFMQQPIVIMASLTEKPLFLLAVIMFSGRLIKFILMAYIGSHAPRLLNKLWGLKGEFNDAGVDHIARDKI